jgi:hypothetical protein
MPEIVPLRFWYPAMYDKWQRRLDELARQGIKTVYPLTERIGWVIHHTVGGTGQNPLGYARGVADMHWKSWLRPGGYNFLVGEDGLLREMCGYTYLGAHAGTNEWNRKSLGLSFQGDFRTRPPSDVMLERGAEFIAETPIPADQWTHREVRPTPTTCPGDAFIRLLPLEDDMPSIDEIRQAIRDETPGAVLGAQFGGPSGSTNRKSLALHVLEIKSLIGALDSEGVSEAELDERVTHLLNLLPDRVLARLRERLGT